MFNRAAALFFRAMPFDLGLISDLRFSIYEYSTLDTLAQLVVTCKKFRDHLVRFMQTRVTAVKLHHPQLESIGLVSRCTKLVSLQYSYEQGKFGWDSYRYWSVPLLEVLEQNRSTLRILYLNQFFCCHENRSNEKKLFMQLARCDGLQFLELFMDKSPKHLEWLPKTLMGLKLNEASMRNLRILTQFPDLRGLSLSDLDSLPEPRELAQALANLSSLEYLYLHFGRISEDLHEIMTWRFPKLRHLVLSHRVSADENEDFSQLRAPLPVLEAPLLQILAITDDFKTAMEDILPSLVDCPSLSTLVIVNKLYLRSSTGTFVLQPRVLRQTNFSCTRSSSLTLPRTPAKTIEEHLCGLLPLHSECSCCPLPRWQLPTGFKKRRITLLGARCSDCQQIPM